MRIPFVGGSATARSLNATAERTVNAFLEMDQGNPRAPVALYGMPGTVLRNIAMVGPHRGAIQAGGSTEFEVGIPLPEFVYFVTGSHVYRMDSSDYSAVECGEISTSSGRVSMATNGLEVLIVDGEKGWFVNAGLDLVEITDLDFPNGVTGCAYIDGYFIVFGDGSQKFYWSETPGTGAAWNGLDFASAEGSPDDIVGGVADHGQLWFVGSDSCEVFDNTGDADQPFQRSGSTFIEQGTVSPWTVHSYDNSVVWLSKNKDGQAIFLRTQGGNPVRFSTHALETTLAGYSTLEDAFAFVFQMHGHSFYACTFPSADATWVFDAASGAWFEWLWRDPDTNELHRHRAASHAFAGGKHFVGDWENSNVYSLEMDVYTDNGDPIPLIRRTQTMSEENARLFFSEVEIDMETGVANDACPEPQVMLRYSNDGGHTWSNEKQRSLGAVGQYGKRVRFGPTGSGRNRVWELSITDPVKRAIFGAFARVEKGS
jgi:hypothetical protein